MHLTDADELHVVAIVSGAGDPADHSWCEPPLLQQPLDAGDDLGAVWQLRGASVENVELGRPTHGVDRSADEEHLALIRRR